MFSKPLAFVLLALGCLTAAAGGAYVAARHNVSDTELVTTARPTSAPAPTATTAAQPSPQPTAAQPVAETEAAVSAPKAEAPAVPAEKADPAVTPAPQKSAAKPAHTVATAPGRRVSPVAAAPVPARTPTRTVPMNGAGTPAVPSEPAAAPAPAAAIPPAAPKPSETIEAPQPEPARAPQYEELILPAASVIGLQVETAMSTERARVEDRVDARVSRDVMAGGRVAIPAGARVIGSVTTVDRGGKIKEQARLGIRFHTLVLADGSEVPLHTDPVYRLGEPPSSSSSKKIGGAAVGGAILGAILGGGKGAAAGGAIGAGAGTAAVMAGDRSAATLRQGELLNVKLAGPATITVQRRDPQ